jgi:hypothetical protein
MEVMSKHEETGGASTMATMLDQDTKAEYLELVRAFPLVSIRDDAHLTEAMVVIDWLTEKGELSAAEDAYLGALTDLVETYDDAHVSIPPTSGVECTAPSDGSERSLPGRSRSSLRWGISDVGSAVGQAPPVAHPHQAPR